jgi:hypothetical protein
MTDVTKKDIDDLRSLIIDNHQQLVKDMNDIKIGNVKNYGELSKQIVEETSKSKLELKAQINGVDTKVATIEQGVKGINDRVGDAMKRLDTQDNRFWTLVILLLTTTIGLVGKFAFFPDKATNRTHQTSTNSTVSEVRHN